MEGQTLSDIVAEASRLVDEAHRREIPVRVMGGVAIRLHAPGDLHPALRRSYEDIDLVTTRKGSRKLTPFMGELGYVANESFNATNAGVRMVFYDVGQQRQVDVFVEHFNMCHKLDLAERLDVEHGTLPLAELLLTKLQIVSLNPKDLTDIAALLLEHDVGPGDEETVNGDAIAKALAGDWGLWRTTQGTIATTRSRLAGLGLDPASQALIDERLTRLWDRVEAEPKTMRWKVRARVGERTRWYEEPDEIAHEQSRP